MAKNKLPQTCAEKQGFDETPLKKCRIFTSTTTRKMQAVERFRQQNPTNIRTHTPRKSKKLFIIFYGIFLSTIVCWFKRWQNKEEHNVTQEARSKKQVRDAYLAPAPTSRLFFNLFLPFFTSCLIFFVPMDQAFGISELCATAIVEGDSDTYLNHLDPNDNYMRYMNVEYLGHENKWVNGKRPHELNHFVLGWVGPPDENLQRDFNYAFVRDHDNPCYTRAHKSLHHIVDVNWVNRGGHVPAGQSGTYAYPSHGYIVVSGAGTSNQKPELGIARFAAGDEHQEHDMIFLKTCRKITGEIYPCNPYGIMPIMASNRPVPTNHDITSRPVPFVHKLACRLADIYPPFARFCDYGHRLLFVFSGGLRWIEGTKYNYEYPFDMDAVYNPHWTASSINYFIFRPGDNAIIAEGTIADVRESESYEEEYDHALYPEIAWNEATGKWTVMWELYQKDNRGERKVNRWTTTIDQEGEVGQYNLIGTCVFTEAPTSLDDKHPPISNIAREYCYPSNMANDYYSLKGIDFFQQDRNPTHATLANTYANSWMKEEDPLEFYQSGNQWLESDGSRLMVNIYDAKQPVMISRARQNIAVIGHPYFRLETEYEDASYLQASYKMEIGGLPICQSVFYLIVDNPDAVDHEIYDDQQYYRVPAMSPDFNCYGRAMWGSASSLVSFVSVWAQLYKEDIYSEEVWGTGFGVYSWLP